MGEFGFIAGISKFAVAVSIIGAALLWSATTAVAFAGEAAGKSDGTSSKTPAVSGKITNQIKRAEVAPPYPVAKGWSLALQKYSGATFLANGALSAGASMVLSARSHSLVLAKVRTYSFTDLLAGKIKSVTVNTHGGSVAGIPLGIMHLQNTGPFQIAYRNSAKHKRGVVIPLMVTVDGCLRKTDVAHALQSKQVVSGLRFLKLDLPGLGEQRLQVLDPRIDFVGEKIHVRSWLITAGAPKETGFALDVVAAPTLEKERFILLKDLHISSGDLPSPELFSAFLEELFNPLFDFGRLDRKTHAFRLSNFAVHDDEVVYSGRLLLAPAAN